MTMTKLIVEAGKSYYIYKDGSVTDATETKLDYSKGEVVRLFLGHDGEGIITYRWYTNNGKSVDIKFEAKDAIELFQENQNMEVLEIAMLYWVLSK